MYWVAAMAWRSRAMKTREERRCVSEYRADNETVCGGGGGGGGGGTKGAFSAFARSRSNKTAALGI